MVGMPRDLCMPLQDAMGECMEFAAKSDSKTQTLNPKTLKPEP